jgi:outer membrane protein assembly factor BamB
MANKKTYLELSEGDHHKFYEITVAGKKVLVRFGRIGDAGQTQTESFRTEKAAEEAADKKIEEKKHKGYEDAVMGVRQKQPIRRRQGTSSSSSAKPAPMLWEFKTKASAFGVFVDAERCWLGNEAGNVYALDHDGKVIQQYKLPDGVMALVADDHWRYAGCNDGKVYDLNGKTPREAYELSSGQEVMWMDIFFGALSVSDSANVTVFDYEGEQLWEKKGAGGWMVRSDNHAVYAESDGNVAAYAWDTGKKLWTSKIDGGIMFGWQEQDAVYAATTSNIIYAIDKKKGKILAKAECDGSVPSCAAAPNGKYIFGADWSSSLYCFDSTGKRLWKLGLDCGSALSMQYFDGRLYVSTTDGSLGCIDASDEAVAKAMKGELPKRQALAAPKDVAVVKSDRLEKASSSSAKNAVLLECVKEKGKLRIKVASKGYHGDWHVQFPRNLRKEGARFVVDQVKEAGRGNFYRTLGEIRTLD